MTEDSRPQVHFTVDRGWINDPLALTWYAGRYHLFYQYVPNRTSWAYDCRWGHAVSDDLLRWTQLPVALEPDHLDGGAWSGSLVRDEAGNAEIFYTSVPPSNLDAGRIRIARPVDTDWLQWKPDEFVLEQPEGVGSRIFRDPFLLRDGDQWRMLVGGSVGDEAVLLGFSSLDKKAWSYDGVVASRVSDHSDAPWTGVGWECPQLLHVDGVDVLIVSVWEPTAIHYVVAAVGTYSSGTFHAQSWQRLTWGERYYAGSSFIDSDGLPGIIYWIRNAVHDETASRAGRLSVPHRLYVENGRVIARPHPNLSERRKASTTGVSLEHISVPGALERTGYRRLQFDEEGDEVVVRVGNQEQARVPRGEDKALMVLADHELVEIWTSQGAVVVDCPTS